MQNKLNEILELCIEKSDRDIFYRFDYRSNVKTLMIVKYNDKPRRILDVKLFTESLINQALEYMQNE